MDKWAMAHPILTFIIILTALLVLEESVANICRAIIHSKEKEVPDNEQAAGKQAGE